jgi:hypothetical protein
MTDRTTICNTPQSYRNTRLSHHDFHLSATQLPLWDWQKCARSKSQLKIKRVPTDTRLDADRWWIAVCDGNIEFNLPVQLTAKEIVQAIACLRKLDFPLDAEGFPVAQREIEAALEKLIDGGMTRCSI